MTREQDEILENLKKASRDIVDNLKKIDVDRETTRAMNEAEKVLDSLSGHIERKREEIQAKGVENTVKEDLKKIERSTKELVEDLEDIVK